MDVCLVRHDGARLRHRPLPAAPAPLLQAVAPSRDGLVGAGAGLGPWDGRAALGAAAGLPGGLGPALARPALPGGKATTDPLAAHPMAAVLRGGRLPHASVSPAARRPPPRSAPPPPPRRCPRAAL